MRYEGAAKWGLWAAVAVAVAAALWVGLAPDEEETAAVATEDPYLWLEDVHGEQALAWVAERNAETLPVLKGDPRYAQAYADAFAIYAAEDRIPYGTLRGRHVYNFWQDGDHVRGLWRRASIESYASAAPDWDVLIDIDALAEAENENWVYSGVTCAPSGTRCLVSFSRGGGDAHVVREFDLEAKEFVIDGFLLPEQKSSVQYMDDDTVLVGTDFGEGSLTISGYPRIVKLWRRGQALADARIVAEGEASDVGLFPVTAAAGEGTLAFVQRAPSFFEEETSVIAPDGTAMKIPLPRAVEFQGVVQGEVLVTLREDWVSGDGNFPKGALIAFPLAPFLETGSLSGVAIVYAPGPRETIDAVATGRDAVYAAIYDNVVGSIHVFRPGGARGWAETVLPLPAEGSVRIVSANETGPEALFNYEGFLVPATLFADDGSDAPKAIKSLPAKFDADGLGVTQHEAVSADGTRFPYFLVRRADAMGPVPTLLYGYGGFEIAQTPSYLAIFGKLWLEAGGQFVLANIRGGGEFGPAWHKAAMLANRQRAYDDFIAAAEDLIAKNFTTPKQLGIMGRSNGGLLVGAVAMQRPDLYGAVVCWVPLLDMIRYTKLPPGASWMAEYGDPEIPEQRAFIEKYSPYQNVSPDKTYPRIFFITSTEDDRVHPGHARKMAARMGDMGHEVFFYENTEGGHPGAVNPKQIAEVAALYSVYLRRELGLGNR